MFYHIFCYNIFVFSYPIRTRSQCWVFAPEFNFRFLYSGLKDYMSKYKERWFIKICIKSYFNHINTFTSYWKKV